MSDSACKAPSSPAREVSYEEAAASYGDRRFWISFFVRPCCPPPGADLAKRQLDNQRNLVRDRDDFTDEQKAHLLSLIDEGESWYRSTPYWSKGDGR